MLQKECDLLGTVLENDQSWLACLDPDFNIVRVSSAHAEGLECTSEELVGRNYLALLRDVEQRALFVRVGETGESATYRAQPLSFESQPCSETSYYDWTMAPVKNGDGAVAGLVLSLVDVTEQEQLRQDREARLARADAVIEVSSRLLMASTGAELLQCVTEAARELTGAQIGIACSKGSTCFSSPGRSSTLQKASADLELIGDRPSVRLTADELRRDQTWRTLLDEFSPLCGLLGARLSGDDGQTSGLIVVSDKLEGEFTAEDEVLLVQLASIASLRLHYVEAKDEVERRMMEWDVFFDAMPGAVLIYDADGTPVRANPAAVTTCGLDPAKADRAELLRMLSARYPDGRAVAVDELPSARALRGESIANQRFSLNTLYGDQRTVFASAAPLRRDDRVCGAILVWDDIAEIEQAQRSRDQLMNILEATPDVIATAASDGRLLYLNEAGRELQGIDTHADASEVTILSAHPEWARMLVQGEGIPIAIRKGVWQGKTAVLDCSGCEIPTSQVILCHKDPEGNLEYLSTIIRDITYEEQLAEENRRQRHFLEELMKAVPVGIAVVEAEDHRYEFANPHYQVFAGGTGVSLVGQTIEEVWSPKVAEIMVRTVDRVSRTGQMACVREYELSGRPEAEPTYWNIDYVPLARYEGRVEKVLAVAVEITGQVLARKRLDAERARLRAVIENAPEGIVVVDEEGHVVQTNASADRLCARSTFGKGNGDAQSGLVLCHPDGVSCQLQDTPLGRSLLDGEIVQNLDLALVWPAGQRRDLLFSSAPIRNDQDQIAGAVAVFQDITERRETERALCRAQMELQRHAHQLAQLVAQRTEALQNSQARLRAILEGAAMGIAVANEEGRLVDCNLALAAILGYSADELVGKHFAEFTHPDDIQTDVDLFADLLAGERDSYQLEKRYIRKDGETVWVNLTVSLIQTDLGLPLLAVGMVEDVTEKKEAQEALIRAEKLALTGRLAASLTHEINNPLQAAIGCLGLAETKLARGEEIARYLEVAHQELRRAARVASQMRDLHRRSREGKPEILDINALLEQVLLVTAQRCQSCGVEVKWIAASGLPALSGVPDQLKQVLLNLVLNAIDAMPEGGCLEVGAACTSQPAGVSVCIADNGIGMAPEVLSNLFEPFYSTRPDGLGLGLFLSRNIVKSHGGRVEVESTVGRGTTFTVWLPA